MNQNQTESSSQTAERKSVRPALIISKRTVSLYWLLLERLMLGLADESISAVLVCPPDCDVDSMVHGAIKVIKHPAIPLPLMARQNKKKLIENLTAFGPTVLHCLCESKSSLTRALSKQLDLPYLVTVNSIQKKRRQLSISSKRCAKIIVPAKSIADNITATYPKFADRVERINIGTFVEETTGCFNVTGRVPSIVANGRLKNQTDLQNLLGAVKHLATDGYQFLLFIADAGRAETALRKSITELDISQTVIIVPKLKPWRSVLAAGDIFIQPVPANDFNLLLLEAMSLGTAVAACKGGVDDLIIEGQTAVVFDPDDELSIKRTLQELFDRREFARRLADGAQRYLREKHTVSDMVSAILRIYHEAQE